MVGESKCEMLFEHRKLCVYQDARLSVMLLALKARPSWHSIGYHVQLYVPA